MARSSGIRVRHARTCTTRAGDCGCAKSFEAYVWDPRRKIKVRKTFRAQAEAKSWRVDTAKALKDGKLGTPTKRTVQQAGDDWLAKARTGAALTRSGGRYKPSVIREHERDLKRYVYPELGTVRLSNLRRRDVQDLVDRVVAKGASGSKVRNVVMPLRIICRRAIEDDELAVNPTANLRLPEAAGRRDRIATPEEAEQLLEVLPERHRALWATAIYAGLRRGELRALRWQHVNDDASVITVEHGWDDVEGEIDPKSDKGTRTVPVAPDLRLLLLEHKARTGRRDHDLVFGSTAGRPFTPTNIRKCALRAWAKRFTCGCDVDPKADKVLDESGSQVCPEHRERQLRPIGLHECRHTYVSLMFDAGFTLERIGDYVGHTSSHMVDHYRHLLEGHEVEAAEQFGAYLARRATGAHRGAHLTAVRSEPAPLSAAEAKGP